MVDTNLQCEASVIMADINESYADFCSILKSEMETTLPKKRVMTSNAAYKNRHNCFKPWWTPDLSELWESCRNSERNMNAMPFCRDNSILLLLLLLLLYYRYYRYYRYRYIIDIIIMI